MKKFERIVLCQYRWQGEEYCREHDIDPKRQLVLSSRSPKLAARGHRFGPGVNVILVGDFAKGPYATAHLLSLLPAVEPGSIAADFLGRILSDAAEKHGSPRNA